MNILRYILRGAAFLLFVYAILLMGKFARSALQTSGGIGPIAIPAPLSSYSSFGSTLNTNTINASTSKVAFSIQFPKTGTLAKIDFRTGTVTTSSTLTMRLESPSSTTGVPDGILIAAGASADQVASTSNKFYIVPLDSPVSVTQGQYAMVVIQASSTAPVPNLQINTAPNLTSAAFPYALTQANTGAAWVRVATAPIVGFEYSDGTYAGTPGAYPFINFTTQNLGNTGTNPWEAGLSCTLPFKARVYGMISTLSLLSSSSVHTWTLYDSDGTTQLASTSMSGQNVSVTTPGHNSQIFNTTNILKPNVAYRIAITNTSTVVDTLSYYQVPSSTIASFNQMVLGTNCFATSRTSTVNAWVDATSTRYQMGFLIDQLADDSSSWWSIF